MPPALPRPPLGAGGAGAGLGSSAECSGVSVLAVVGGILEVFGSGGWLVGAGKFVGAGIAWLGLGVVWIQGFFGAILEFFGLEAWLFGSTDCLEPGLRLGGSREFVGAGIGCLDPFGGIQGICGYRNWLFGSSWWDPGNPWIQEWAGECRRFLGAGLCWLSPAVVWIQALGWLEPMAAGFFFL